MLEAGEEMMSLVEGQYKIELRSRRVWVDVWNEARSVSRRILSLETQSPGVLICLVQRFGGKPVRVSFLDLDRPQNAHRSLRGTRDNFCERFRRMLLRQFPGWELTTVSSSMDLQRSFSPVFPRAIVQRGNQQIAALACPAAREEAGMISFALIWYEYVRARADSGIHTRMALFLPENAGNITSHRLRWLIGRSIQVLLLRFNAHGLAGEVDANDLGNLDTKLRITTDLPNRIPPPRGSLHRLAVAESGLEQLIRSNVSAIDATLSTTPIYDQVLAFAGGDRDIVDLLAIDTAGRLSILELKISEDIHLPIQALDYWMRIKWHAASGELDAYFPRSLSRSTSPKLLLVAPAMSFHSTTASILGHFSPEIEVERIGVNSDWRDHLKVVMRLRGAELPKSHGRSEWAWRV
jgi:hypothetical protein